MRRLVLVAAALAAAPAHARDAPGLAEIVAAERAFAKRCGEVGVRDSFLEFFAENGVSFTPEPGPARPRLEKRPRPPSPPPFLLSWAPQAAEISAGGDLGWSTGPSRIVDRSGKSPTRHGHYFSLWRRQAGGAWKVELDIGVESPAEPVPARVTTFGPRARVDAPPADEAAIRRLDESFCAQAGADAPAAYRRALARNARVQREPRAPVVGRRAGAPARTVSCTVSGAGASAGLGYAYGSWEAGGARGFYTRVWRLEPEGWRIAAEVATAVK
jgi:ketosteroid isomerase-like protein